MGGCCTKFEGRGQPMYVITGPSLSWNNYRVRQHTVGPPRWNVAIETLSDDVLLEIFDLCGDKDEDIDPWYDSGNEEDEKHSYDAWYALAHV